MEKFTRDIQELTNLNQELRSLSFSLGKKKDLMAAKQMQIFILDLQDYVSALGIVTDSEGAVEVEAEDPKLINGLLTRQNELLKILQRDFQRILTAQGDQASLLTLNAGGIRKRLVDLENLIALNQFLLQDNLNFQSILDSGELAAVMPKRKSFWQRLFQRNKK